jgi:hypothetical protein
MSDSAPIELWRIGPLVCVVLHHRDAESFEIRVLHDELLIERRWFDNNPDALAFASQRLRALRSTALP